MSKHVVVNGRLKRDPSSPSNESSKINRVYSGRLTWGRGNSRGFALVRNSSSYEEEMVV